MAHPVTSALVARLTSDFGALQEAALAHAFGTAAPETAAALGSPELADAHAGALLHAETLARGDLHLARIGRATERERRALGLRLRRISRARKRAVAVARQLRRESGTPPRVRLPLAARVLRTARPDAFGTALGTVCAERGLTVDALCPPSSRVWEWARDHGLVAGDLPSGTEELLTCSAEEFVQALLLDAREEENPHLAHGAVVERWDRHARTARAWGRYAVALAEHAALAGPPSTRAPRLDDLEAAYQDAAVLALRAHEARWRLADLRRRIGHLAVPVTEELWLECGREAALRLAAAEPVLWEEITTAAAAHRLSCEHGDGGCPSCHRPLAARLFHDSGEFGAPGSSDRSGDEPGEPDELGETDGFEGLGGFGGGEEDPRTDPAAPAVLDAVRYALLDDVPEGTPWAVADAAVNAEESALCGYGWAAADGSADWGDSMASSSGEAEVVAVCQAALALLDRHPRRRVLVLCDSVQAVDAVRSALDGADVSIIRRTVLFPEGRDLLDRLSDHRDRVEVRWLKGHIGHDLNEAADALARLALRRADGRTPAPAAHREAARILRSLEVHALADATAA